jgi:hypothetical protein
MKNTFRIFGLLVTLLVFSFVGCETVKVAFTPTEKLNNPGFILTGDSVGIIKNENPAYEWKFFLVSGAGDTDNNLFEIKNGNTLVAKKTLKPRDYSIRVKMLGVNQNEADNGIQNIFTFKVAVEAPPPKPIDFPQNLQGRWLCPSETVGLFRTSSKTLIIQGHNLKADGGADFNVDYMLMAISDNKWTLKNTVNDDDVTVNVKLVNGNLVFEGASNAPGFWMGTFLKQK